MNISLHTKEKQNRNMAKQTWRARKEGKYPNTLVPIDASSRPNQAFEKHTTLGNTQTNKQTKNIAIYI